MKPIEREISILSLGVLLRTKCHKQVNIHFQLQEEQVTEVNVLWFVGKFHMKWRLQPTKIKLLAVSSQN